MDNIIDEATFSFIFENLCKQNNVSLLDENVVYRLKYLINKTCNEIVIKTNRNTFPTPLKYLVIDIVQDTFNEVKNETAGLNNTNQNITSMSEAGRSVSFGVPDSQKTRYNLLLEQQMKDRELQINKFKLLYKVECPYAEN